MDSSVMEKKSQITIFFIVGAVLLLFLIGFLFIRSMVYNIDDNVIVPEEILPAKNFIDYCIDEAAKQAFFILGRQGGFINVRADIMADPGRRLSFGNGAEILPYWYYNNQNWIPTIEFMETELSNYINEHFMDCLHNSNLLQPGYVIKILKDNSTTKVSINEKDVIVEVVLPMQIEAPNNNMKTKIKKFTTKYNLALKQMMDLAKYMLVYENTYNFLENITIDLMAMNENIPFTGMITECGTRTWHIRNVKKELQQVLFDMYPEIRVEGTDYYPFEEPEEKYEEYRNLRQDIIDALESIPPLQELEGFSTEPDAYEKAVEEQFERFRKKTEQVPNDSYFHFHFLMPMLVQDTKYKDFGVNFEYNPDYGMDIQAKPSSDGVLRSNSAKGARKYLSFFCLNIYHFTYDITYPVVITLTDDNALNSDGFKLRFAIPVIIRNNEGMRSKQHMEFIPSNEISENYCFDDPGRKVVVKVYDKSSLSDILLDDVNISMICVRKRCFLGTTGQGNYGRMLKINLTTACGNPYLLAEKEGYQDTLYLVESESDDIVEIEMIQLKNFAVQLQKHNYYPLDKKIGLGQSIMDGMVSMHLSVTVDGTPYENDFIFEADKENIIELPVADADLDISLTYFRNSEDYSGGYYNAWEVSQSALTKGNTIVFHVAEMIISTLDEDAAKAFADLNELESSQLKPEIR